MKGVFEVSGNSRYDDFIVERYHFPQGYRLIADQLVGDWILYRETRAAGGSMAYFAVAFVDRIEADPNDPSHSYARMSSYLKFDLPVPYRDASGRFAEKLLRDMARPYDAGRTLRGASVRLIDQDDFVSITNAGLQDTLHPRNRVRLGLVPSQTDDQIAALLTDELAERRIEQLLINRAVRNANFRNHVLVAYNNTCAVTGLKLINGGGRAEAEACHIRPVQADGPDTINNGIALSGTAHWMFDRGLISLSDNFEILVSRQTNDPDSIYSFLNVDRRARLPARSSDRPYPHFLAWHREHCFKS